MIGVDLDQNGFITMQELRTGTSENDRSTKPFRSAVLQATGDRPTDEEALEMIAEADLDGDGRSERRDIDQSLSHLGRSQLR